jgi:plasmid maintenance system killer protein
LKVSFKDTALANLYSKGFEEKYRSIPADLVKKMRVAVSMAAAAKKWEDIIKDPPFKGELVSEEQCIICIVTGWYLELSVKFSEEGNKVTVVSFQKKHRSKK